MKLCKVFLDISWEIIPIFLEMTVLPQNCVIKFWLYFFRQLKEVLISISSSLWIGCSCN